MLSVAEPKGFDKSAGRQIRTWYDPTSASGCYGIRQPPLLHDASDNFILNSALIVSFPKTAVEP